ncbi:MAG TPA: AMP-binding protein [Actinomycetota bacterium]|nr:AMP-binding protein [Actinomycetota bacterium]
MDTGERNLYALQWPPGQDVVAAFQRLWDEGAAILPVRPDLPPPALRALLDRARPAALVDVSGEMALPRAVPVAAGTALCVPTAGSTGEPKLVLLSHAALETAARLTNERLGLTGERWLCALPLDHVAGLMILVRARLAGAEPVVLPRFDPEAVGDVDGDVISLVPTMLDRLVATGADLRRFRWILLGGAAVRPELLERARAAGARIVRTYGMTETCGGVVYDGVPLEGVRVGVGADGMIRLHTPTVMDGYRFDDVATAAAFEDGWFVTGDLGEWDGEGLRVLGRADEVIVTGGEKVSPQEVEAILASHPSVADVAVAGLPDDEWGQRVVAYVVPSAGTAPTLAELRSHVGAAAAPYKAPKELVLVDDLPRLPSGKVARASLSSKPG